MKLTVGMLKKLIAEEKSKLVAEKKEELPSTPEEAAKDAEDLEVGREADSVAKPVDFYKELDIKEAKLRAALKKIQEAKAKLKKSSK